MSSSVKTFLGNDVMRTNGPHPSVLFISMYKRTAASSSFAPNDWVNAWPFVNLIYNQILIHALSFHFSFSIVPTDHIRSTKEGNVFNRVCLSVCPLGEGRGSVHHGLDTTTPPPPQAMDLTLPLPRTMDPEAVLF